MVLHRALADVQNRCNFLGLLLVANPVSYTHLDVYKRQVYGSVASFRFEPDDVERVDGVYFLLRFENHLALLLHAHVMQKRFHLKGHFIMVDGLQGLAHGFRKIERREWLQKVIHRAVA